MNEKLIIFDDIKTYPEELITYLNTIDPKEEFPKIDKYIEKLLNEYNTYIYHCTRLKNKKHILENGIKIPCSSKYLQDLFINTLKENFNNEYNFENWIKNYPYREGRGKTIHFAGTLTYLKNHGCIPLLRNFGGELLLEIIKYNLRKIVKDEKEYEKKVEQYEFKLRKIGNPYLIKIKSPLKELNITNYSSFIGTINRYYKDYSCYGVKIIPSFGKIYNRDIKPEEIIDILDVCIIDNESFEIKK